MRPIHAPVDARGRGEAHPTLAPVAVQDVDLEGSLHAPLLWGCFLVALASGAIHWVARRNLAHRLRVVVGGAGTRLELVARGATTTLTAPVSVAYGKTEEFVSSGKGGRWVPVRWLLVSGGPGGESSAATTKDGVRVPQRPYSSGERRRARRSTSASSGTRQARAACRSGSTTWARTPARTTRSTRGPGSGTTGC